MELVRKLFAEKDFKGACQSYGEFLCSFCNQIVKRHLGNGKRDKSCGCARFKLSAKNRTGKKRTIEQREKMSISQKGKRRKPQTQETIEKRVQKLKGKKRTEEQRQRISASQKGKKRTEEYKQKMSNILKGTRLGIENPMFGKQVSKEIRQKISIANKGKKLSEEHRQKIKENHADFSLENAPNWQGGISFEPYTLEFNKEKKQQVLERDNYKCQDPNCDGNHKKLHIHHIDYDKKNNSLENLITLCSSCHSKTNGKKKRHYFTEFYQNIMIGKLMECLL